MAENQQSDEDKLASLLLRWEEAWDLGEEISPADLCADCPELTEKLQQQIDVLKRMAWMKQDVAADEPETNTDKPNPLIGETLAGRYCIEELLAEGGFGRVYRAFDPELDRHVAVKVSKNWSRLSSADQADALLEEARRVAKLRHPGIVAVHDVGRHDGSVFFVTDLIEGRSLAEIIGEDRLKPQDAVKLVAEIADVLHFAHEQGLAHLDIKPANILIDQQGRPLIADFGIAASIDQIAEGDGATSGTLPYMAPEQVAGEVHLIDARTDIHALGVILYELLTGQLPYPGRTPAALREQILLQQPKSPRSINAAVPKQVEQVCLRALAKHPADRFSTAEEMASRLRACLASHPSTVRWGLLISVGVLVCLLLPFFLFPLLYPARQVDPINQSSTSACIWKVRITPPHGMCLAFSPDGKYVALGVADGTVRILASATGKEIRRLAKHACWVRCLLWSPDGKLLFSGSGGVWINGNTKPGKDHSIRVWSVKDGTEVMRLEGHVQPVLDLDLDWEKRRLASASGDITVRIWDLKTEKEIWQAAGGTKPVSTVAFGPRRQNVFWAGGDGVIRIWNIEERRLVRTMSVHRGRIWRIRISPNGQLLLSCSGDGTAKLWTLRTGNLLQIFPHPNAVTDAVFSADGNRIATACMDGGVRVWDSDSGILLHHFKGHLGGVWAVAISQDGKHVVSTSNDSTVRMWRLPPRLARSSSNSETSSRGVLHFDGSSRIVTPLERFAPVTLEAWIRPDRYEDRCHFVIASDIPTKWGISVGVCGVMLAAERIAGLVKSNQVVPIRKWSHIAAVFSKQETRLYFNGKLVHSGPPTEASGGTHFVIGNAGENHPREFFLGQIRCLRISQGERYHADFTPEERFGKDADNASASAVLTYDGAHVHGNRIIDLSGNGNDGRWERMRP